jgi:6-phosphogluconolactonase
MSMKENIQIIKVADAAALAQAAAEYFVRAAAENIAQRGRFTVALSGGSTPKAMFALLAAESFCSQIDWTKIYVFWGDERCVPPDHPESNYRMTSEALLSKVNIPEKNVFRIHGELAPADAAKKYAETLLNFFQGAPIFDLVFLGMGADGHTASLFPGTSALHAPADEIAVENYVEKLNSTRLTLTAGTLNAAREIIFLVAGADKASALQSVLEGGYLPEIFPSQLIQPKNSQLKWMIDEAAASRIV